MIDLSVIVLSYNTKDLTVRCLQSLHTNLHQFPTLRSEIVVVDNSSSDQSVTVIQELIQATSNKHITWNLIENTENFGFSKGNNVGLRQAQGRFILFLNSDVITEHVNFPELLKYLDSYQTVGALTVKVLLDQNSIDPASHRGFPTVWNACCYFIKLERFLGHVPLINRIVGGYHLTYLNLHEEHEIDSPTGAFYLIKKTIADQLHGFDEDYFMYGEDLDLSYRLKKMGYKIVYYPRYTVLHLKHRSGLETKNTKVKKQTRKAFYAAMKIFYTKHYRDQYPSFIRAVVFWFIDFKSRSAI